MAYRFGIMLAVASIGIAGVFACVGDDPLDSHPDALRDGASPDGETGDGALPDSGQEAGPPCDHDLCADFDRADWVVPWKITQSPTPGSESVVALTDLNQPPSAPNSLRTLVRKQGDHAVIGRGLPWKLGNASRRVRVEFKLFVEQHDARGVVSAFNLKSDREVMMLVLETNQSLSFAETSNADGGTVLTNCTGLGTLPLRKWTRVVMTLEGRTPTSPGWLTLTVGDEAVKRCDLASVTLAEEVEILLGLMSLASGTRIAQYDDVFVDLEP